MNKTRAWMATACAAVLMAGVQGRPCTARADDKGPVDQVTEDGNNSEASPNTTKGRRCTFTRPEKIGMLTWIFPLAGAIYTPFACKRNLFDKD